MLFKQFLADFTTNSVLKTTQRFGGLKTPSVIKWLNPILDLENHYI